MAPWQGLRDDCFFKRAKCFQEPSFWRYTYQLLVPEILGGSLENGLLLGNPVFALDQVCVAPNTCDSYRLEIGMEPE
jgi:hypothetical protein